MINTETKEQLQLELPDDERCLRWLCDFRVQRPDADDWRWWREQPNYRRRFYLSVFEECRQRARLTRQMICRADLALGAIEESYQQAKTHAELWAKELKQAFIERRPCPIIAAPRYEYILTWAFEIAQLGEGNFVNAEAQRGEHAEE